MNKTQRLFNIIETLSHSPASTPQELAEKLNVTERSVYRYLHELKKLGFRIHKAKNSKEKSVKKLIPPITFSSMEVLALVAACQSLLSQEGLPYTDPLKTALQKVQGALSTVEDKRVYYSLRHHFTYISETLRDYSPWKDTLSVLNNSIRNYKSVKVTYDSYSGNEVSDRVLDPYDLFFNDGNLYLAAYCHKREEVCIFRIDRIQKIKSLTETFKRDPAFNLETYLGSSWRIWRGAEEITIKFVVYPPASRLFRESSYHETQQIQELDNDQILCTIKTYNTPEIKSWLLSWGKQIKVLEPEEVVGEIRKELQISVSTYQL